MLKVNCNAFSWAGSGYEERGQLRCWLDNWRERATEAACQQVVTPWDSSVWFSVQAAVLHDPESTWCACVPWAPFVLFAQGPILGVTWTIFELSPCHLIHLRGPFCMFSIAPHPHSYQPSQLSRAILAADLKKKVSAFRLQCVDCPGGRLHNFGGG